MKNWCFSLLYILFVLTLHATPKPIPPILSKLLKIKGSVRICYIGPEQWIKINDLPNFYRSEGQHLLKTDNGLYLTIPGTGRLYKAKIKGDNIDFQRIDSTYFSGYNFNSLSFNFDKSIYNFGGQGFWQNNGGLRIYDTVNNEWDAIKLNKSIHKTFNLKFPSTFFYYIDNDNRNLYIGGNHTDQNYVKDPYSDSTLKNKIFKLDVIKGDWQELGIKNFNEIYCISLTKFGILSYENLIDLENNKIYNHDLSVKINSLLGNPTQKKHPTISYVVDSTIYFGNASNRFDSITITSSNLNDTHQLAYIPLEEGTPILSKLNILTFLLICSSLGFLILFRDKYFRKSSNADNDQNAKTITHSTKRNNNEAIDNPIVYTSGKLIELLSDQEKEFISYIFKNSKDERLTTIDEANKILGTLNKSIDIQKRVRGEMINNINQKLSIITKVKRPIIEKQRSEFDKRSFEYFIQSENFNLVNDIVSLHK